MNEIDEAERRLVRGLWTALGIEVVLVAVVCVALVAVGWW